LVGQDFYGKPLSVPHQTKCGTGFFWIMLKPTPPRSAGAAPFCARPQRTIPGREATNEGHQRKGTLQHSSICRLDRLFSVLRNLPTMSRLNELKIGTSAQGGEYHGSERSIPTSP
jgi:hypothetical protein